MSEATQVLTIKEYYQQNGFMFMASTSRLPMGPLERNDWNEDDMREYRWSVVEEAGLSDVQEQNRATGWTMKPDGRFRFFYKIVALD